MRLPPLQACTPGVEIAPRAPERGTLAQLCTSTFQHILPAPQLPVTPERPGLLTQ